MADDIDPLRELREAVEDLRATIDRLRVDLSAVDQRERRALSALLAESLDRDLERESRLLAVLQHHRPAAH